MTPRTPSPPSNMEVETLCFGGVFLLRGQDNCTASKGRWTGPCTVRASALKPTRALKMGRGWVFQHDNTQNTRPRQQRSGSRRSTQFECWMEDDRQTQWREEFMWTWLKYSSILHIKLWNGFRTPNKYIVHENIMVLNNVFVPFVGLNNNTDSICSISDLDRSRLTDTRSGRKWQYRSRYWYWVSDRCIPSLNSDCDAAVCARPDE